MEGCPYVDGARARLTEALEYLKIEATWHDLVLGRPGLPEYTQGAGSPTVFVDGEAVGGLGHPSDRTFQGIRIRRIVPFGTLVQIMARSLRRESLEGSSPPAFARADDSLSPTIEVGSVTNPSSGPSGPVEVTPAESAVPVWLCDLVLHPTDTLYLDPVLNADSAKAGPARELLEAWTVRWCRQGGGESPPFVGSGWAALARSFTEYVAIGGSCRLVVADLAAANGLRAELGARVEVSVGAVSASGHRHSALVQVEGSPTVFSTGLGASLDDLTKLFQVLVLYDRDFAPWASSAGPRLGAFVCAVANSVALDDRVVSLFTSSGGWRGLRVFATLGDCDKHYRGERDGPPRFALDIGQRPLVPHRALVEHVSLGLPTACDGKPILVRVLGGRAKERPLLPSELVVFGRAIQSLCEISGEVRTSVAAEVRKDRRATRKDHPKP